jgi:hypothetical protein
MVDLTSTRAVITGGGGKAIAHVGSGFKPPVLLKDSDIMEQGIEKLGTSTQR